MGLLLVIFAIAGFAFGAFWSAGFTYTAMNDKTYPWYTSVLLTMLAGIIDGLACGDIAGCGMAYLTLGRN